MKNSKPGMYEYQLRRRTIILQLKQKVLKRHHFIRLRLRTNATVLHYDRNDSICHDGDLILFDLGCSELFVQIFHAHYQLMGNSLIMRRAVYQAVLDAQLATIEIIKPGVALQDVNEFARKKLAEGCKKLGLIENDDELSKYYYHGIGHYLGLDTHDVGGRGGVLQPGMVITIEPGLYIAEEGIGIRIEDDILVTKDGHENLSKDIIKSIEDIEAFMAEKK